MTESLKSPRQGTPRRVARAFLRTGGIAAALVALLAAGVALLPYVVDLRPVKARLLEALSERIHARVTFQNVDLALFPTPRLVARAGTVSIPGRLSLRIAESVVVPELLPLARGIVRISWVELKAPSGVLVLPELREPSREEVPTLAEVEGKLVRAALLAGKYAPSLGLRVSPGELWVSDGRKSVFWIGKVGAEARLPPKQLTVSLSGTSNFARQIVLSAELDPAVGKGRGSASLKGARLEPLRAQLTRARDGLLAADGSASASLRWEGPGRWSGEVSTNLGSVLLGRGSRRLPLQGVRAAGEFSWRDGAGSARLSQLRVASPKIGATVTLARSRGVSTAAFSGTELEVGPLRDAALSFFGDLPSVREIFDVLRGGRAPTFSWVATGTSMVEFGRLERMAMAGALREGALWLPWAGVAVHGASGEVRIAGGVLAARRLSGRTDVSLVRDGTLRVGLRRGIAPLQLDLAGSADLAEVKGILDRRLEKGGFTRELSGVSAVQGRAEGRVVLDHSGGRTDVRVDARSFRLAGRYRRVPFPVEVRGAALAYRAGTVEASGLAGFVGRSSFRELSGSVCWAEDANDPRLRVSSGAGSVDLAELSSWLSEGGGPGIAGGIRGLRGGLLLSSVAVEGPATRPGQWRFNAKGALQQVSVSTPAFPGPVAVARADFTATPEEMTFTDARGTGLDMALQGTLRLRGLRDGRLSAEGEFSGTVGAAGARWVSDRIDMPEEIRLRCPLTFERAHLLWEGIGPSGGGARPPQEHEISFSGDFVGGRGTRVSLSVRKPAGGLFLDRLLISDADSKVSGALLLYPGRAGLDFHGTLQASTLDSLFEVNRFPKGRAQGDFHAEIDLERPQASSARGSLKVSDLQLPWPENRRPIIESASLRATGREVEVDSAALSMEGIRVGARGTLAFGPDAIRPDLVLEADVVDWDQWRSRLFPPGARGSPPEWPVRGTLRVEARQLRYGGFVWSPVEANLRLSPGDVTAEVTRASVCGVSTPGTVRMARERMELNLRPSVQNGSLEDALECLVSGKTLVKGNFTLIARFSAAGNPDTLLRSGTGELDFQAEKGSILRYNLLSKIFTVLNVTEVLRGKLPDLGGSGFRFSSIRSQGKIRDGVVTFSDSVMDGGAAKVFWTGTVDLYRKKLDLVVVVAPFKTLDAILGKIPLVSYLVGRTLISIPVRVVGDWAEPAVVPLPPSAVGSGVLGLMQRTLTLPFKLVEPLFPEQAPEPTKPAR